MEELGADLIKCFYTGPRFREIIENTSVPVLTIGAEKLNTDREVLEKAKTSVDHGARGIIFGRNIFMSRKPGSLIKALDMVMNGSASVDQAQKEHDLT
jgi:DhnA family fructose-bisphosphate aldolase class Ia